jgi:hypothetical protein
MLYDEFGILCRRSLELGLKTINSTNSSPHSRRCWSVGVGLDRLIHGFPTESIFKTNVIVNRRRMVNRTLQHDGFHFRSDAKTANDIEGYSSKSRTQLVLGVWRWPKCRLLPR